MFCILRSWQANKKGSHIRAHTFSCDRMRTYRETPLTGKRFGFLTSRELWLSKDRRVWEVSPEVRGQENICDWLWPTFTDLLQRPCVSGVRDYRGSPPKMDADGVEMNARRTYFKSAIKSLLVTNWALSFFTHFPHYFCQRVSCLCAGKKTAIFLAMAILIHHFGSHRNISTTIGLISIKVCTDIHGLQRMNSTVLNPLFTYTATSRSEV